MSNTKKFIIDEEDPEMQMVYGGAAEIVAEVSDFLIKLNPNACYASMGLLMLAAYETKQGGFVEKETFLNIASDMWDAAQIERTVN